MDKMAMTSGFVISASVLFVWMCESHTTATSPGWIGKEFLVYNQVSVQLDSFTCVGYQSSLA
jgi:hypothetical protein